MFAYTPIWLNLVLSQKCFQVVDQMESVVRSKMVDQGNLIECVPQAFCPFEEKYTKLSSRKKNCQESLCQLDSNLVEKNCQPHPLEKMETHQHV